MIRRLARKLRQIVDDRLFYINGMKPWTRGYHTYKRKSIIAGLEGGFRPDSLAEGYGYRVDERVIEYPWFFSVLPEGEGKLLDAGSILNHGYIISQPKLASKKIWISTLAPEGNAFWNRGISYVYEDMRALCYREDYFDWIVCLSTLEHVGMDNTLRYTSDPDTSELNRDSHLDAVREMHRVLKPGGTLYLSFPFGKDKSHEWLQFFDADMTDKVIEAFGPSAVKEIVYQYTESGWVVSSREDAKDATYFDIHAQKDYDADYAAASRAIVTLELTK